MKLRKIIFALMAAVIFQSGLFAAQQWKHEVKIKSDFEDGTVQGWGPRGDKGSEETLSVAKNAKHSGEASLKISNRQKTWQGPIHQLTDKAVPGDVYSFDAWIYYDEGPDSAAFTLSVERSFKDEKATHSYANISAFQAKKGVWTEIKAEYTIPADPTQKNVYLYIERPYKKDADVTADDKISFYVDDIVVMRLDPASRPKIQMDIPNLSESWFESFSIGAAVMAEEVDTSGQKAQLLMKHFTGLVAGNDMKMDTIEPKEGTYNWARAEQIIQFAELTGMRVRWHTLQWHSQCPDWVFQDKADPTKPASKDLVNQRLKTYIQTVMKRYKGRVESYDVVNEVLNEKGEFRTGAEGSKWYDTLGPDFVANAFKWAREADPTAQLVINDYNLESNPAKRDGMYNLVKDLKAKKVPVDAIGLQMHISNTTPSVKDIKDTIAKFASLGVKVVITEMDMSIYDSDKDPKREPTKADLLLQAQRYKDIFAVYKDAAAKGWLDMVVIWGTTDNTSWKNDFPVPGRGDAPLLFDGRLQAKPSFWALVDPKKVPGLK
jgi:endo-1,4-beta-xylanase